MKPITFFIVFVSIQLVLITLEIAKQNYIVRLSYTTQRLAQQVQKLQEEQAFWEFNCVQQERLDHAHHYATQTLLFKPLTLKQVQRVEYQPHEHS